MGSYASVDIKRAVIDETTAASNEIVAAVAGRRIRLLEFSVNTTLANPTTNLFRPAPEPGMLHAGSKGVAMNKLYCVAVAVAGLGGSVAQARTVLHVDDNAPLAGDGLIWNTAYRFLQDALADAAASGGAEALATHFGPCP